MTAAIRFFCLVPVCVIPALLVCAALAATLLTQVTQIVA